MEAWQSRILLTIAQVRCPNRPYIADADIASDTDIDIVIIALLVQLSTGTGGQPVFNLAN